MHRLACFVAFSGLFAQTNVAPAGHGVERLNELLLRPPPAADRVRLIAERHSALAALAEDDAARALLLALPDNVLAELRRDLPGPAAALLEERGEWTGPVTLEIEHPAGQPPRYRYWLRAAGAEMGLLFASPDPPPLRSSDVARVRGVRLGSKVVAAAVEVTPAAADSPSCGSIGEQKVAALLVSFPDETKPELDPNVLREMLFGAAGPSLNSYWRDASHGQTWATGDVFGWIEMDHPSPASTPSEATPS
ncbi:MAG: hypothetical protein ACHQ5A_12675 [Opitutales bacterium]